MKRTVSAGFNDTRDLVFVKSFRHWRTGKIITAPPGKVFCFPRRERRDSGERRTG